MDLNMVRAGIVAHSSQWPSCGYNEIQKSRERNVLINVKDAGEASISQDWRFGIAYNAALKLCTIEIIK